MSAWTERSADALAAVAAHAGKGTMPPVVIAKDGIDTERRLEDRQGFAPLLGIDCRPHISVAGIKIAEQKDDVGILLVGEFGNVANARCWHQRFARRECQR
jgi:hypothetical protein